MIGLLYRLIVGIFHFHKWKIIEKTELYSDEYDWKEALPIGTKYVLQCEKCGTIKIKKG